LFQRSVIRFSDDPWLETKGKMELDTGKRRMGGQDKKGMYDV
jgi:hypothetical protein